MDKLPYPFPGMNPYLEHHILWEGFHARLIGVIANQLQPQLDPRYITSIEERVFVEGPQDRIPDAWIENRAPAEPTAISPQGDADTALIVEVEPLQLKQKRVEILDSDNEMRLVAVIEVVSPTNKRAGAGRKSYQKKQREVLAKKCHLIEIDLLRRGAHVLHVPQWRVQYEGEYDYLICVSRWPNRARFELYPRQLSQRLPRVGIPLVDPDRDVILDLQTAVEQVYEEGRYGWRLKYQEPCEPALSQEAQKWATACLGALGEQAEKNKPKKKRK